MGVEGGVSASLSLLIGEADASLYIQAEGKPSLSFSGALLFSSAKWVLVAGSERRCACWVSIQ